MARRVTVSVGLPGSGKTTYLRKYAEKNNALYLSADDIREAVYGDSSKQANPGYIWGLVHQVAQDHLASGGDVVIDGTFVKKEDRKSLFEALSNSEFIEVLWFLTPFEVCLKWNKQRDRVVPEKAMHRMRAQLLKTPPCPSEGFDRFRAIKFE